MAGKQHFERNLQEKFDSPFREMEPEVAYYKESGRLPGVKGADIWLGFENDKSFLLKGVTRIEFQGQRTLCHTVLGETISILGEVERVSLQAEGLGFRFGRPIHVDEANEVQASLREC